MYRTPVCCTSYTSPNDLWLQIRWDGGQKLKALMIAATNWAAQTQAQNVTPELISLHKKGEWVLARPNDWNLWFRGKLLKKASNNNWLVQLVDFGDRLIIPESHDRLLPMPEFFNEQKLESCAVPCRLARIHQRKDWSKRDTKLLEGLLTMTTEDRILDAEIDWEKFSPGTDTPVPVELYQCHSELSINDMFGQRTASLIARAINWSAQAPSLKQQPPVHEVKLLDKPFEGLVSHVTERGIVFVQMDEKRLNGLQSQLELFDESENLHRFSASSLPNKDEIFAVFRKPPLCHYRGRVLELLGGQRVKLLIIDFGFELTVDWNQCARLPTIIRYKPQCCPFLPLSLASSDNPVTKCHSLASIWNGITCSQRLTPVKVTVTPIDVPDSDPTEVQTANIEVHLGDDGRKNIVEFLLNCKEASTTAGNYRECREVLNWDADNIVCGTCTHVVPESNEQCLFFVPNIMQAAAEQLKLSLDRISPDQLVKLEIEKLPVHSGSKQLPVLIQSEDGSTFQRGSVEKLDEATRSKCDVIFVDTGKRQQSIPVSRLYTLPSELLATPTICVKCRQSATCSPNHIKIGDVKIFTIIDVADGAYTIEFVGTGN